ncbi:MAG: redoxin domain-containing protein [Chthoniobacterales bacterium]|nr:redoxin domain-containing protein [Chthoniobacterales bacterium]
MTTKFLLSLAIGASLAVQGLHAQDFPTSETIPADRDLWPREVTVKVEHQLPVIINGRQVGSSKIPAGRTYPLKAVLPGGVKVDALGADLEFATADTDLLERLESARQAHEAHPPAPAPSAALGDQDDRGDAPTAVVEEAPADAGESQASSSASNAIAKDLTGDLVSLADGRRLKRLDDPTLGSKKYIAVYFSAAWCGPCREFTPKLVEWYGQRTEADHGKFEVILMSRDRNAKAMEDYMKEDKMPWPALAFTKRDRSPLAKYKGNGIPCLVIIDGEGNVLSDSYVGGNYVGPSKVLKDLERLLAESS